MEGNRNAEAKLALIVTKQQKSAYIKAANRQGLTLREWVIKNLDAVATLNA
jgi:predicted HicB family RNase H-like nuclease